MIIGIDKLVIGIVTVFTSSMMMTMSKGAQSATNYAVLSSASHLIGFAIMPVAGGICDSVGYFTLFSSLACTGFLSIFMGDYLLRKRLVGSGNGWKDTSPIINEKRTKIRLGVES